MHYITCNTAVLSLSSFVGRQEHLGGTGTTHDPLLYMPLALRQRQDCCGLRVHEVRLHSPC